jgi:predicted dehydrogenase
MLLGMSSHPVDLAISFFGAATEVTSAPYENAGAISLAVLLKHQGGKWSELMLGCHGPRIQERVEISGLIDRKHGYYAVDDIIHLEEHTAGLNGIDVLAPSLPQIEPVFDLSDIRTWRPDFAIPNMGQNSAFLAGYAGEIREFVDAIIEKRMPDTGGEEGLKAMRVIDVLLRHPEGGTFVVQGG